MNYIIDKNTKIKFNETQALLKAAGVSPVDSIKFTLTKDGAKFEILEDSKAVEIMTLIANGYREVKEFYFSPDNNEIVYIGLYDNLTEGLFRIFLGIIDLLECKEEFDHNYKIIQKASCDRNAVALSSFINVYPKTFEEPIEPFLKMVYATNRLGCISLHKGDNLEECRIDGNNFRVVYTGHDDGDNKIAITYFMVNSPKDKEDYCIAYDEYKSENPFA